MLVESSDKWFNQVRSQLAGTEIAFIPAKTLPLAERRLVQISGIDAIAVAETMEDGQDTLEWIKKIRSEFHGILIGFVSGAEAGQAMVQAGCNFWVHRSSLAEVLFDTLGVHAVAAR